MHSLLKQDSRDLLRERVAALQPDTPARWGRFTAPRMLAHLIESLRMTSGDLTIRSRRGPRVIRRAPLKHLLIYVLPFPRGLPTFPELVARPAAEPGQLTTSWAEEQQAFSDALDVVAAKDPTQSWPDHGALGPLTAQQWGVLQYRHLDHHLRQFGQ